ncbi:MAG TPA: hypothetical protein VGM39_06385, partial [Kofleriaceae bacterium]
MARVRLPLEVGVSSLNNLVFGVVMIPIGLAIIGGVVAAAVWLQTVDDSFAYPLVFGAGLLGGGAWCLRKSWRERPSDALFEAGELVLDGGAYDGMRLAFSALDPALCVVEAQVKRDSDGKEEADGFGLKLVGRQGDSFLVAIADSETDVQSLRDLHVAIVEQCSTAPPIGRLLDEQVRWLVCTECATMVAPSDVDALPCPGCGTRISMTEDIRTRVRAQVTVTRDQAHVDRVAPQLLDQPGARSTTRQLAVSLAVIGLAWPVAAALVVHLAKLHALTPEKGVLIAVLPFLLIADGFFLSRLRLVDRRALATVTLSYAAIPPAKPGAPPTCHNCSAPLPATPAVVGRCLFCGIENLMNLDLRPSARRAE